MTEVKKETVKKPMPLGVMYRNLEDNKAFKGLSEFVELEITGQERLFFDSEESLAETQRLKAKHYRELWNKILTKIANSKKEK